MEYDIRQLAPVRVVYLRYKGPFGLPSANSGRKSSPRGRKPWGW
jgi:hypothetical protein